MSYYYPQYAGEPSSYYQLASDDYELRIRQQPRDALLAQDGREKSRKPIDPPPIVEVTVREGADPIKQYLQSPYLFMMCSLVPVNTHYAEASVVDEKGLCGSFVSSLHKLKNVENREGGFFVFGDVSVKRLGEYKLLFSLYELQKETLQVVFIRSILSDDFTVHPQKEYPGLEESTALSRAFADQGVRLRLRKESRAATGPASRKRAFTEYTADTSAQVQAVPSRQAGNGRSSTTSYGSSQIAATATFPQLARSPSTRQLPDSNSASGYSATTRSIASQDPATAYGSMTEPYSSPVVGSRPQGPQMPGAARSQWTTFSHHGQPSTQANGSGDFDYRGSSSSLPRLDPSLSSPQASGMLPSVAVQPGSGIPTNLAHGAQSYQPQSYYAPPAQYTTYQQAPPYRSNVGYSGQPVMYASEQGLQQQQQPQFTDSTAYSGSYDATGRPSYSNVPSTRGWPS